MLPSVNWLSTLPEPIRGPVLAWMRDTRAHAQTLSQTASKLSGPGIPVGAAHFDEFIRGEVLHQYLGQLGRGKTPEEALQETLKWAHEAVKLHNQKSKDISWKRSIETADPFLIGKHKSLLLVLEVSQWN